MTIRYNDLAKIKNDKSTKMQIVAALLERGGILPAHEVVTILQSRNALPSGSDGAYKRAKTLLYHHVRESYYLQREKGDIIRLIPGGKDDTRLWSNPLDAPDLTAFIFSLLVVRRDEDLTYPQAIPHIREYIAQYENEYHTECSGKKILCRATGQNLFYTIKKQAKHFLTAKGIT